LDESLETTTFNINTTKRNLNSYWDKEDSLSKERISLIDRSVLKAFVVCGIPFRVIENPYFINMLKNLQSSYNPSSRDRLTTKLLCEETARVEIKINNILENAKNLTLGTYKYFINIIII